MEALLDTYTNDGLEALERALDERTLATYLQVSPFMQWGRPIELMEAFGGKDRYLAAVRQLEQQIYAVG